MARRFLVAGNWKMHGSLGMTQQLIAGVANQISADGNGLGYDVLVCPPNAYLASAEQAIGEHCGELPFFLGGQNVNANESGAYTGEVSLPMLAEFGCSYVLLGHSERRELFDENDTVVAEKFAACVAGDSGIVPVLCIGETLAERQGGNTEAVVDQQLDAVLDRVGIEAFDDAVIAYEPVWAIGTGETATQAQAQQVHEHIRSRLRSMNSDIAESVRILYGGSVKPENALELFSQPDIDGGLIGGASLKAESFAGICEAAQRLSA